MKIERTENGETIHLTDEEEIAIENAITTVVTKYLAHGHDPSKVDKDYTWWFLLGILQRYGLDAVNFISDNYDGATGRIPDLEANNFIEKQE